VEAAKESEELLNALLARGKELMDSLTPEERAAHDRWIASAKAALAARRLQANTPQGEEGEGKSE
jgi:hypothetical protein